VEHARVRELAHHCGDDDEMARLRSPGPCAVESRLWDVLRRARKVGRLASPERDNRFFQCGRFREQIALPIEARSVSRADDCVSERPNGRATFHPAFSKLRQQAISRLHVRRTVAKGRTHFPPFVSDDRAFTSSSSCAMKDMIVTADKAVALIHDGDSVCCKSFVGIGTPDELIMALERASRREPAS
jgi:hypothetical protein